MSGHLFITRGNLLDLACDALLVPSGIRDGRLGHVGGESWRALKRLELDSESFAKKAPTRARRVVRLVERRTIREPAIWLAHTGDDRVQQPEWYGEAIGTFVREAAGETGGLTANGEARPVGDARPLLGVPLVGVGQGGMGQRKGEVVLAVVEAIDAAIREVEADVALVLLEADGFSAAQQARSHVLGDRAWTDLTDGHHREARQLALRARDDRLVLFMGAGVGIGAGLPSWGDLLKLLASDVDMSEVDREQLDKLDARDAAGVLGRRLPHGALADAVVAHVQTEQVALVHQLLASLPVQEAVTTNYDRCFEKAWKAAGKRPRVLPAESAAESRCWLLKLHGSVDDPERIVLSRDDYLRFEGEGVALAGIVQAMLLTRHMLFVGYSLSDDNFHRLMHQVRSAVGERPKRPGGDRFATALTPVPGELVHEVWEDDVSFVSTAHDGTHDPRRLAILLDLVSALAVAPAAHLLDRSYLAMFSEKERDLREHLLSLWRLIESETLPEPVADAVREALARVGVPAGVSGTRQPTRHRTSIQ